ncbi:hypothetical protein Desde_3214 [Desulfitobacterium dehalogenans ATCC 51507]|uniref:Uncharacterized protein n=1 Tax=Desulfitobacterium dehalogenans (strain ATCC 51507 / DSM 9161 / JW/IU-DC1) TaxID=756499 RepID=I4AC20_DESDJ|nr:hypothetical protein [Desulfitobacterium dehalogenans]AFM01505.1 hypothetical protein Desde_3214 [Desulfitobacterium dehalogenans ATCC 51507]
MAEPAIFITEPTYQSKKFEDTVTVVRIFNPNKEKMLSALKRVVNLAETHATDSTEDLDAELDAIS